MAVHRGVPNTEDPADERRRVVAPLAMLLLGLSWPLLTLVLLFVLVDVSNWSPWSILVVGCWLCSGLLVVLPSTERLVVRTLFRYRNPDGDDRRALDAAWGAVADRAGIDPATYSLWVADWNLIDSGSSFGRTIVVSRTALETVPPERLRAMLAHQLGRHHSGLPWASGLTYWYGLPARVAARICVTVGRLAWVVGRAVADFVVKVAEESSKENAFLVRLVLGAFKWGLLVPLGIIGAFGLVLFGWIPVVLAWLGRRGVLHGDLTAKSLGFGPALAELLDESRSRSDGQPGRVARLLSHHPSLGRRTDLLRS